MKKQSRFFSGNGPAVIMWCCLIDSRYLHVHHLRLILPRGVHRLKVVACYHAVFGELGVVALLEYPAVLLDVQTLSQFLRLSATDDVFKLIVHKVGVVLYFRVKIKMIQSLRERDCLIDTAARIGAEYRVEFGQLTNVVYLPELHGEIVDGRYVHIVDIHSFEHWTHAIRDLNCSYFAEVQRFRWQRNICLVLILRYFQTDHIIQVPSPPPVSARIILPQC